MNAPFDLQGKRALVTGAAQGIGEAVAEGLLAAGASVALLDLRSDDVEETAERLRKETGGDVTSLTCDVTSSASVDEAFTAVTESLGGLDIAVHNAGVGGFGPAEDTTDEEFDRVLSVNLRGVFYCCRAVGST